MDGLAYHSRGFLSSTVLMVIRLFPSTAPSDIGVSFCEGTLVSFGFTGNPN